MEGKLDERNRPQDDLWMCFLSTLRISRDLQSLVGTGDPISETLPKRESNKTPSFLGRVQSLIRRACFFFHTGFSEVEGVENEHRRIWIWRFLVILLMVQKSG